MLKPCLTLAILTTGLIACCPVAKQPAELPPPISLYEQLDAINAHARAMPCIRAKGDVTIHFVDDDGHTQKITTEGVLVVRQRFGSEAIEDPADVYLEGRVAGDWVFQAAKNQQKWWFINKHDKIGWMGDVEGTPDTSGMHSGGMMRADLMLQALAVTEILPHAGETIAMKVEDDSRSNDVMILRLRPGGTAWVKREFIVDRDSRDVRQVKLEDPAGRVAAWSELKDYRPIMYGKGEEVPKGFQPPKFPFAITVKYPTQKLSLDFTVKSAYLLATPPEVFDTPDFAELGIKQGK